MSTQQPDYGLEYEDDEEDVDYDDGDHHEDNYIDDAWTCTTMITMAMTTTTTATAGTSTRVREMELLLPPMWL